MDLEDAILVDMAGATAGSTVVIAASTGVIVIVTGSMAGQGLAMSATGSPASTVFD